LVIQCDNCSQSLSGGRAIRCLTFKKHYCGDCDFSFHAQKPFHNRWLVSSNSWYSLKTMEFVDYTGKLVEKGTTVFSHLIAFKLLFIILFQMFQSPVLTMQDFERGYFPWLLVEGKLDMYIHCAILY
jgi:hypothetical protein